MALSSVVRFVSRTIKAKPPQRKAHGDGFVFLFGKNQSYFLIAENVFSRQSWDVSIQ